MIAFRLLSQPTRWNPHELITDATVPSVNWLRVPLDQLTSRLPKVNLSVIKVTAGI